MAERMHKWRRYICILGAILLCLPSLAQKRFQYNITTDNGLLHNHVYFIAADSNGYLWLACKKGLLRYNGYEMRAFTMADGLANDEIFNVFEDRKGRMWIYTLSNELGYIYNDKYKKVYFLGNVPFVAARRMLNTKDGITFVNSYRVPDVKMSINVEKNDTVRECYSSRVDKNSTLYLDDKGVPFVYKNKAFYRIHTELPKITEELVVRDTSVGFNLIDTMNMYNLGYPMSHFIVFVNNNKGYIYAKDIKTAALKKIQFFTDNDERIITPYERYSKGYFVSNKNIYEVDYDYERTRTLSSHSLVSGLDSSDYILNMLEHPLWQNCYSVPGKGMYIVYEKDRFRKSQLQLNGYYYAGYGNNNAQYWWNRDKKTLVVIGAGGAVRSVVLNELDIVYDIKPYRNGKVAVAQNHDTYVLDEKTLRLGSVYEGYQWAVFDDTAMYRLPSLEYEKYRGSRISLNKALMQFVRVNDSLFFLYSKVAGFCKIVVKGDTFRFNTRNQMNNSKIVYDSLRQKVWCYNSNEIALFDMATEKMNTITSQALSRLGINRIERILVDGKYGNVFIKDYKRLYMYNPRTNSLKSILNEYKLENALIFVYKNTIVAVGQFGVLFARIEGAFRVSKPVVCYNIKSINYKNIPHENVQLSGDSLLLNTNNGLFSVHFPAAAEWAQPSSTIPYRLLMHYADTTRKLNDNDTLLVQQEDYNIRFELINPMGVGTPVYTYRISGVDTAWVTLNANEFNANGLEPDIYYDIRMVVSDDVWQSKVLHYKLYITPRWWQTYYGIRIVWVAVILSAALLVWIIVSVTRRIVNRKNRDRTMQLELRNLKLAVELKSIYSQVNPHFIFNTLSTGMYFIKKKKMEEAYNHIAAFSNLLRAYIKSSRNKYITLAEEIENLQNYITLQQARFENKFDSQIIVAPGVNTIKNTIPSLLLQPLVENAINHGLFHKDDKGELKIEFRHGENEDVLICIIDDDGIGRARSKMFKEEATVQTPSYGTDLVKELIDIFNNNEPIHIDIEYIDKQPPLTGTTVILTIKNLRNDTRTV